MLPCDALSPFRQHACPLVLPKCSGRRPCFTFLKKALVLPRLVLSVYGPYPNALDVAPASLYQKKDRCYHPLCCLFVGVAQMLWVLPVNHFFQKCIGATTPCVTCLLNLPCATTPLVLLVRGSCPIRLGADRAPLFKNAMVLQHLALPVRGSCPQSLGAAPVCYLSADVARMFWVTCFHTALVLPPLVLPKQRIHTSRFRNADSVFAPPPYQKRLVACTAKTKDSHRTIP